MLELNVLAKPLSPAATDVCDAFHHHPHWQIIGFPPDRRDFHDIFWPKLLDADFATVNEKDSRDCGFQRFWNPLAGG